RKRDRGGMEAVIDESLGDVLDVDTGRSFEPSGVEDALVRYEAVLAGVQQFVLAAILQSLRNVVGAEDGDFRRHCETIMSHHRDVGPRNGKNRRTAPRGG